MAFQSVSCVVRVPSTKAVTAVHLLGERVNHYCCCFRERRFTPFMDIELQPEGWVQASASTREFQGCPFTLRREVLALLEADCVVRLKVKRGNRTIRKKIVDARHLIAVLQDQRHDHVLLVVNIVSFTPLRAFLRVLVRAVLQPANVPEVTTRYEQTVAPQQRTDTSEEATVFDGEDCVPSAAEDAVDAPDSAPCNEVTEQDEESHPLNACKTELDDAGAAPCDEVDEQDEESDSPDECANTLDAVESAAKEAVGGEEVTSEAEVKNVLSWAEEVEEAEANGVDVHAFPACEEDASPAEEVTSEAEVKNVLSWAEEVEEAEANGLDVHAFPVCQEDASPAEEVILEKAANTRLCAEAVVAAEEKSLPAEADALPSCKMTASAKRRARRKVLKAAREAKNDDASEKEKNDAAPSLDDVGDAAANGPVSEAGSACRKTSAAKRRARRMAARARKAKS